MKINAKAIDKLVAQFDDCTIEELYENHEVMGNWVIITCDLKQGVEKDGTEYVDGGIFSVLNELEKFNNIENLTDEIFNNDDNTWFEYVSFEWT